MKVGSAPSTGASQAEPRLGQYGGHDAHMNDLDIERSYSTDGPGFY